MINEELVAKLAELYPLLNDCSLTDVTNNSFGNNIIRLCDDGIIIIDCWDDPDRRYKLNFRAVLKVKNKEIEVIEIFTYITDLHTTINDILNGSANSKMATFLLKKTIDNFSTAFDTSFIQVLWEKWLKAKGDSFVNPIREAIINMQRDNVNQLYIVKEKAAQIFEFHTNFTNIIFEYNGERYKVSNSSNSAIQINLLNSATPGKGFPI